MVIQNFCQNTRLVATLLPFEKKNSRNQFKMGNNLSKRFSPEDECRTLFQEINSNAIQKSKQYVLSKDQKKNISTLMSLGDIESKEKAGFHLFSTYSTSKDHDGCSKYWSFLPDCDD